MLLHGRVVWLGCTIFLMAALVPTFAQTESAIAGTPAFTSTVKAATAPLPSGCTTNMNHNKVLRRLTGVTKTRVQHLCDLGKVSRHLFLSYTRNTHVKAIWLPNRTKCAKAPNKTWAGECWLTRRVLRNHAERLQWVRSTVNKLTTPVIADNGLSGSFLCIHRYEGSWTENTGNGYYGGLQMDKDFMNSYGKEFLAKWGTADKWPAWAQIQAAERAHASGRGFTPWPNTARACGLL